MKKLILITFLLSVSAFGAEQSRDIDFKHETGYCLTNGTEILCDVAMGLMLEEFKPYDKTLSKTAKMIKQLENN